MIGRLLSRLLDAQSGWAKPLGDFNVRWMGALLRAVSPIKDFLNGKWIGHSVHAAITDIPIGAITVALLLDFINMRSAADIALALGILAMIGAAVTGAADYVDTDDEARVAATVHSTVMTIALVLFVLSLVLRLGNVEGDRTLPIVLAVIAYLVMTFGAWVGGEVVYAMGNMVNRHAWRFGSRSNWVKLDLAEIPENTPTAGKAGAQSLVVVRQGERIFALHAQCAHANGPLAEGRIVDGCIECPWHYSRFELDTGRRKRGPSTFDQPVYDVRAAEGGGWEVRRVIPGQPMEPEASPATGAGSR